VKLILNEYQRAYLLEVFKASENNAINGKDAELAKAFSDLYDKISPTNAVYYNLNREEAETIVEFCDIVSNSLFKAINFLKKDTDRSKEEVDELLNKAEKAKAEIEQVSDDLRLKIKNNPKKESANESR
jgi:DNA-directed RNA polymerase alpha subunit